MSDDRIKELSREFPRQLHKTKKGGGGRSLTYIEAHSIIDRLNTVVGLDWSYRTGPPQLVGSGEGGTVVYMTCELQVGETVRCGEGAATVAKSRGSDVAAPDALENAIKTASSDALKRAARLFGVGLYLYRDGDPSEGDIETKSSPKRPPRPQPIGPERAAKLASACEELGFGPQAVDAFLRANTAQTRLEDLTEEQGRHLLSVAKTSAEEAGA